MMPRIWGWLGLVLGLVVLQPSVSSSQQFAPLHATLASWDDAVWLDLLDRNYSVGGRHSDLGVLKQWYDIDRKYHIDLYYLAPNLTEDYQWTRSPNGVRWISGSLTARDLAATGTFKTEVAVGKKWNLMTRFDLVSLPRVRRGAFRANLTFSPRDRFGVALKLHLDPQKPGTDLGAAVSWHPEMGDVQLEFWYIDILNDLAYVTLDASRQAQIDLTEDYTKQPFGLKADLDLKPIKNLRLEAYGAVITSSSIHVFHPESPDSGFHNSEDIWYAGGLAEWSIRDNWILSVFGTNRTAASGKSWDDGVLDEIDYELDERATRLGAATVVRPGSHWEVEFRGERNWRPELRLEPASGDTLVNYRLDAWLSRLNVRYQSRGGFYTDIRFGYSHNDEPLGTGQVPTAVPLAATTYRIGVELGWRFGKHVFIAGGAARDIGGDTQGTGFGGARGRGVVTW